MLLKVMKISDFPFFRHVNFNPDKRELRSFAIAMVIGFTVLGLVTAWYMGGFGIRTYILWGVGILLASLAHIPGVSRLAYLGVYLPSSIVGYIISHVILTLLFFLVFLPIGVLLRLTGKDLLRLRPERPRAIWQRLEKKGDLRSYYRQF